MLFCRRSRPRGDGRRLLLRVAPAAPFRGDAISATAILDDVVIEVAE